MTEHDGPDPDGLMTFTTNAGQALPLVGGVITKAITVAYGDKPWEKFDGFIVKMPNGKTHIVTVSQDEEGNGPGALFIDDDPPS
jgi:hypothetical protein